MILIILPPFKLFKNKIRHCKSNKYKNKISVISMKLFLRVLLFVPLISFSQNDIDKQIPVNILLDSINKQLIYQTNTSFHRISLSNLKTTSSVRIKKNNNPTPKIILKNNKLLFLHQRGGDIFELNSNDSLYKTDNSNIVNFFIGSKHFVRKDTIFRHGGYGYWTLTNFLIYFEDLTKEWQSYSISEDSEIPPAINEQISFTLNDSYYFFGGNSLHEKGVRTLNNFNNEIWEFNFKTKKWKKLGDILRNLIFPIHSIFKADSNLFLLNKQNKLFKIDIVNNTITKYKIAPILYQFVFGVNPVYYKDFVYYLNGKGKISKIALSKLTKEAEVITKFYDTQNITEKIILASVFIIILVVIFYVAKRYANAKTIKLLDNGVRFKNKFIELDSLSIAIIKMVEPQDIELSKVYNLVKKDHLSKIQNERIKNQYIDQINLQLSVLTGIKEDFLIVSKSNFDKRYKIIRLNRAVYGNLL